MADTWIRKELNDAEYIPMSQSQRLQRKKDEEKSKDSSNSFV